MFAAIDGSFLVSLLSRKWYVQLCYYYLTKAIRLSNPSSFQAKIKVIIDQVNYIAVSASNLIWSIYNVKNLECKFLRQEFVVTEEKCTSKLRHNDENFEIMTHRSSSLVGMLMDLCPYRKMNSYNMLL